MPQLHASQEEFNRRLIEEEIARQAAAEATKIHESEKAAAREKTEAREKAEAREKEEARGRTLDRRIKRGALAAFFGGLAAMILLIQTPAKYSGAVEVQGFTVERHADAAVNDISENQPRTKNTLFTDLTSSQSEQFKVREYLPHSLKIAVRPMSAMTVL